MYWLEYSFKDSDKIWRKSYLNFDNLRKYLEEVEKSLYYFSISYE